MNLDLGTGASISDAITFISILGAVILAIVARSKWKEKKWPKICAIIFSIAALAGFLSGNYFNSKINENREVRISKSKKGITSKFDPDCTKRTQNPGEIISIMNNAGVIELKKLINAEKYSDVLSVADKVSNQMPECPTPYYYRGFAHYKKGEMSKARKSCKKFVDMTSGDPDFANWINICNQIIQK